MIKYSKGMGNDKMNDIKRQFFDQKKGDAHN